MANLAPPSSQKAGIRPISFLLDTSLAGPPSFVDLLVRPEDLSRSDPSRVSVQQTLGGAWADSFGPGITQITISGHTGWRRTEASGEDGLDRFIRLKETVFDEWHNRRATSVRAGLDPNEVRLTFTDALDDFSVVVAPLSFSLRRSRSRPLLAQYQIAMMVMEDLGGSNPLIDAGGGFPDADILEQAGLESMAASIDRITGYVNSVRGLVDSSLVAPVRLFMQQTTRLYSSVRGLISAGVGVVKSVLTAAQLTAQAGLNLFRSLAAVLSIPQQVKAGLVAIGSAYSNIFCVLRNALRQQLYYQDYSDLYGASNCSSTSGGRPISALAGQNPFYQTVPTGGPSPVSISRPAQTALASIANADVVLAPPSAASLGANLRTINAGLVVQ